jgi:hypothetical protein
MAGLLDRLAEFFKSLAGVITAFVLLGGAIAGAWAFIQGGDGGGGSDAASSRPPASTGAADLFTNRDSGPAGTTVLLSGEGFAPGEGVVLRFHVEEIGRTAANDSGKFSNVSITIPSTLSNFAPQTFDLVATGQDSAKTATRPFKLTG